MKAIITDYDYTLSDKFMTVEFLHLLEENGLVKGYRDNYAKLHKEYTNNLKSYNDFVQADMELVQKSLKGLLYLDFIKVLREEFKPQKNLFDWSKELRDIFDPSEWLFIVVSSTMDLCLERMQDVLNFDTYFCSSYEVRKQIFTGEFRCQITSKEKGRYVRSLCKDLDKVVVVGDSPGDFEMLESADSAYLFEPNEHTLAELGDIKCKVVDRDTILSELGKE